jgi:hypothetical protein
MSWTKALQVVVVTASVWLLLACASSSPVSDQHPQTNAPIVAHKHQTVALLGASGMVGNYLIREALARGHSVRALARTPAKLEEFSGRITIVQGDALDPVAIGELLHTSTVVISALGPVKADGDAARFVSTRATDNVLQVMAQMGLSRYLVVSGAAVVMPGDKRNLLGWWIRTLVQVGLSDVLQDKQAEYERLSDSAADWTLVRCPLIDPQAFRYDPMISLQTPPAFRVRAGELARFIIDQIDSQDFVQRGPFIGSASAR